MISPRPWKIKKNQDDEYYMSDANDSWICDSFYDADSEHIIKCVNEYDQLKQENAQLKEALRKCEIISNNVLYFDDNSDYSTALWKILNITQGRKATDDCYDVVLKYIEREGEI